MTNRYFALRVDGKDIGVVKQSWLTDDGGLVTGMEFYRMTKKGWMVDNTVFTEISGQAGSNNADTISESEAGEIAMTLYGCELEDYAPAT